MASTLSDRGGVLALYLHSLRLCRGVVMGIKAGVLEIWVGAGFRASGGGSR